MVPWTDSDSVMVSVRRLDSLTVTVSVPQTDCRTAMVTVPLWVVPLVDGLVTESQSRVLVPLSEQARSNRLRDTRLVECFHSLDSVRHNPRVLYPILDRNFDIVGLG